jgi:hypothetical protein
LEWEEPQVSCGHVEHFEGHAWEEFPAYAHPQGYEYQVCRWCGLRKQYDEELTRYVYDREGVLAPETPISVLEDAVVPYVDLKRDFPMSFEEWVETRAAPGAGGPTPFERAVTSNHAVEPCRGPHRVHEWGEPEVLEEDYNGVSTVTLRGCKHCPVHLLTQFWKGGQTELSLMFGTRPPDWWNFGGLRANPRKCLSRYHGRKDDFCPDCGLAFGQQASEE